MEFILKSIRMALCTNQAIIPYESKTCDGIKAKGPTGCAIKKIKGRVDPCGIGPQG